MRGGALDYAFCKVDHIIKNIRDRSEDTLHKAFADHLEKVSKALHDLEWVWSGDISEGREEQAIRAVISPTAELEQATREAERALAALQAVLERGKS